MKSQTILTAILAPVLALFVFTSCQSVPVASAEAVIILIAGNTYVTEAFAEASVDKSGIKYWTGTETVLSSWFKTSSVGRLNLFLNAEPTETPAILCVTVGGQKFTVKLNSSSTMPVYVGEVKVEKAGYVRIDMRAITNQPTNPKVIAWLIEGSAAAEPLAFVRDFEPYWGLRGPSVHMKYTLPEDEDIEYFYNEITVPEGEDKIGSYFMTNGFGEGYCGIQVNSATERRILFSLWSPFVTDDPQSIPADERIVLLKKGENVTVGEFGNEGSGGQSYRVYNWQAGETYKLLTRVRPNRDNSTSYTAWFFNPDANVWDLIASFKRPKTSTWYKGPHSFLENFLTSEGYLERSVHFSNQWARTAQGKWIELTEGLFTYDATAAAGVRMDYAGGVTEDGAFFLKNGGFFNLPTSYKTTFTRTATGRMPQLLP